MSKRWGLMCPNFKEAQKNRERIADKNLNREYWDSLERTLSATPWDAPLPSSVPLGRLPYAGKKRSGVYSAEEEVS